MKISVLLWLFCFFTFQVSYAQSSDLFQTWYLLKQQVDLGGSVDFFGPDVPRLIIHADLTYNVVDGCDEYGGTFIYNENSDFDFNLKPSNLFDTTPGCTNNTLIELKNEEEFFCYLTNDIFQYELHPGFISVFKNEITLNTPENRLETITISPNPTSEILNFLNLAAAIDTVKLYTITGALVQTYSQVGNQINISEIQTGTYFLVLEQNDTSTVKRIVKH